MTEAPRKFLVIDLDRCDRCATCRVGGRLEHGEGYGHPCSHAVLALREKATFALICRRCRHASCIEACPFDALERGDDGTLWRHNLRCVSCKSCAVACPFGTIYPELLPFYNLDYEHSCKACLATVAGGHGQGAPACLAGCPEGALEYREVNPGEAGVQQIDDFLAARTRAWLRAERPVEAAG